MSKKGRKERFLSAKAEDLAKEIEALAEEARIRAAAQAENKAAIDKVEAAVASEEIVVTTETEIAEPKKKLKRRQNDKFKHTMPVVFRVLFSVILLMGAAICFAWFLIWRTNNCDVELAMEFIQDKPDIFAYNMMALFCLMAVVVAVTWRPFLSVGTLFSLLSIMTYINLEKVRLRDTPLLPDDFYLADQVGGMMEFIDPWAIVRLLGGVSLILVACALLDHYARKVIGRDTRRIPKSRKVMVIPRVAFTSVSLAMLGMVVGPYYNQTVPDWVEGSSLIDWNQLENYENNGFLIGFISNLGQNEVKQPADYSVETIEAIAKKYEDTKQADTDRRKLSDVADNVIVILDETFYDPALLDKYYSHRGGDVTPNLHKIFQKYPSGYMYSTEYGGGTANVEFEVFTGLSNYWFASFPYVSAVPRISEGLLAAANWAKDYGFATTAIHSYDGRMYKRNLAYPVLGFDEFIDESEMKNTEHDYASSYINDQAVYNEILDLLESRDEPQMIGAITMQNHGPYNVAQYPELEFPIINQPNYLVSSSFQSIHAADEYLGEFIERLDQLEEKTVVLWFGDHAAGILDAYYKSQEPSDQFLAQLTPYFIYANFEIENPYNAEGVAKQNKTYQLNIPAEVEGVDLPVTTPNCLLNTMYDILNVEKPAMSYLVSEVCKAEPILTKRFLGEKNPASIDALRDYELVNYDLLAGKRFWNGQ